MQDDISTTRTLEPVLSAIHEGDFDAAQAALAEVLDGAGDLPPALRGRAIGLRGQLHGRRGAYVLALTDLDEAQAVLRAADAHPFAVPLDRGLVLARLGTSEEAIEQYRLAIEWYASVGDTWRGERARHNLATVLLYDSRYREALAVLRAAPGGLDELGPRPLATATVAAIEAGDRETAQACLARLERRIADHPSGYAVDGPLDAAHVNWARAHVHLADQDPRALDEALVCVEVAERLDLDYERYVALKLAARAALAAGDPVAATVHQDAALAVGDRLRRSSRRHAADLARMREEAAAAQRSAALTARAEARMLAVVSHDLRAPLSGIIGAVELLRDAPLGLEDQRHLDLIQSSADLMQALVSDLLDASAQGVGRLRVAPRPVLLSGLLDELVRTLEPGARAGDVVLSVQIEADVPDAVELDPVRTRQILLNLLSNAVKATPAGRVVLQALRRDAFLILAVDDDGPGIPARDRQRVFDAFEQSTVGLEVGANGVGLGLYIAGQLARAAGGRLDLIDREGPGTRFEVALPLVAALVPDGTPLPDPDGHPVDVLLVDDSPVVRKVTAEILARLGARVRQAGSGTEALASVRGGAPDLILLDMVMPGMDGPAVLEALRDGGHRGPVIALTGSEVVASRVRAASDADGLQGVLVKPVRRAQLRRVLRRWGARSTREG